MGAPAYWPWVVLVDETLPEAFTYSDAGVRTDLTGSVFRLVIQWSAPAGGLVLTTGVDAEIVIADQVSLLTRGVIVVTLSAAQRALLPTDGATIRYQVERSVGGFKYVDFWGEIVAKNWVDA